MSLPSAETFAGRRVLITGAAGSIGSALARAIASAAPDALVLLDASEQGVYELDRDFAPGAFQPVVRLGSVLDRDPLAELFERHRPEIIFHAAAFKHVPLLEREPFAAIGNNAFGTAAVLEQALAHRSRQLILVSTDKAADPASIMGASKRIAEMLLLALPPSALKARAVRLGNVVDSRGSVLPLWREQIAAGQAVTVTHPDARRYFMSAEQAVSALMQAAALSGEGGVFMPEMGAPVRIADLARQTIEASPNGPKAKLVFTALRPGDKLEEVLVSRNEWLAGRVAGSALRRAVGPPIAAEWMRTELAALQAALAQRDLPSLLAAVQRLVPEYRPSDAITAQLAAHAGAQA